MEKHMNLPIFWRILPLSFFALFSQYALAHPNHETGLLSGFIHPFLGLDHILAMLAVGLWAGRLGKQARVQIPSMFVFVMAFACVLAVLGMKVPYVEQGIALSVVFLGLLLLFSLRFSTVASATLIAFFAFFHGAAHGIEMPANVYTSLYIVGFAAASVLLHLCGILVSHLLFRTENPLFHRITGFTIFCAGISLSLV
ncbi:HupE/UreJ family protein [Marinomonas agarivorans]|nr:HupE/UreJ family protein [Marinomonas agarivorans]